MGAYIKFAQKLFTTLSISFLCECCSIRHKEHILSVFILCDDLIFWFVQINGEMMNNVFDPLIKCFLRTGLTLLDCSEAVGILHLYLGCSSHCHLVEFILNNVLFLHAFN